MMISSLYRKLALVIVTAAFFVSGTAQAATLGDAAAGRAYAATHCASCHSIVPNGNTSAPGAIHLKLPSTPLGQWHSLWKKNNLRAPNAVG